MQRVRPAGFTLIEMMIVLAIVGILAAIAYPSYSRYVLRSYRADAEATLVAVAQSQEKYYTLNNSYASSLASLGYSVPLYSQNNRYTISMDNLNASATLANGLGYSLKATANLTGGQSTETCGNLTLDSLGTKGMSASGVTVSDCWK
jgi:type IV pilus assembly protein PilE